WRISFSPVSVYRRIVNVHVEHPAVHPARRSGWTEQFFGLAHWRRDSPIPALGTMENVLGILSTPLHSSRGCWYEIVETNNSGLRSPTSINPSSSQRLTIQV